MLINPEAKLLIDAGSSTITMMIILKHFTRL